MRLASCSRREAEQYIEGGWVRVDGVVVETPMQRITQQQVQLDPQARLGGATEVTILLHRSAPIHTQGKASAHRSPAAMTRGLISAQNHWPQDPAPTPLLQRHLSGLQTTEMLEAQASGLWVFTQDWRIRRKLTEDAALIEREWLVEVSGHVEPDLLLQLNHTSQALGIAFKVSISSTHADATVFRWAVKGSHPGLLVELCARHRLKLLGMKIQRLGRVGLGGLPAGMWRFLLAHERF
jgi:23S rRNA pseudouridine2604 synthase